MRHLLAATVLIASISAASPPARATVLRGLSLEDLCARSKHIVRAKVVKTRSVWVGRQILTRITIRVEAALHGGARPGQTLTLWRLGGQVGRYEMRVAGAPTFFRGERAMLFLSRRAVRFFVTGMVQGRLRIATRSGRDRVHPTGQSVPLIGKKRVLAAPVPRLVFERRVRRILAQKRRRRR